MLELGVKFLIAYFLGSVMGSMVVGRLKGGVDIREMGSGNAGGTNALRTQGLVFAIGVIVIDIGKGALATGVVPQLELPFVPTDPALSRTWLTLCCAAASVIGHVWPMWHNFRGGKGAATLVGTLLVLDATLLLPVVATWVLTLVLTGYVGLSTILAGISAPVYLLATRLPADQPLFIYCVATAMYIVFSHRSNIARMRSGDEPKVRRAMIFQGGR
jgi:glycerol-3-phosphate acyltransferase PlsY